MLLSCATCTLTLTPISPPTRSRFLISNVRPKRIRRHHNPRGHERRHAAPCQVLPLPRASGRACGPGLRPDRGGGHRGHRAAEELERETQAEQRAEGSDRPPSHQGGGSLRPVAGRHERVFGGRARLRALRGGEGPARQRDGSGPAHGNPLRFAESCHRGRGGPPNGPGANFVWSSAGEGEDRAPVTARLRRGHSEVQGGQEGQGLPGRWMGHRRQHGRVLPGERGPVLREHGR